MLWKEQLEKFRLKTYSLEFGRYHFSIVPPWHPSFEWYKNLWRKGLIDAKGIKIAGLCFWVDDRGDRDRSKKN